MSKLTLKMSYDEKDIKAIGCARKTSVIVESSGDGTLKETLETIKTFLVAAGFSEELVESIELTK